jgi:ankyrin repeat protein
LVEAIVKLHPGIVKMFINNGAKTEIFSTYGSALQVAAEREHLYICKLLHAAGADLNGREDEDDETPLARSIENLSDATALWLISVGADVNKRPESDYGKKTPLMKAITTLNEVIVKALVEAGADLDIESDENDECTSWTALNYAKEHLPKVVDYLMAAGAKLAPPSSPHAQPFRF